MGFQLVLKVKEDAKFNFLTETAAGSLKIFLNNEYGS